MNRKKEELKDLVPQDHSTELSIDNIIRLNRLKNIFVTKEDFESFRNDQNEKLYTIIQRMRDVEWTTKDLSESLKKFLQYRKDEQAARREKCWW